MQWLVEQSPWVRPLMGGEVARGADVFGVWVRRVEALGRWFFYLIYVSELCLVILVAK